MCYNTYMVKITIQADLKCQELKKELFFTIKVFCDVFITIGLIVFLVYRWFGAEVIAGLVLDCAEEYAVSFHLDRFYCIL